MTFHIHIKGIVQGVGFRPFVYKLALKHGLNGNVNNTTDGVHINLKCSAEKANDFLNSIINNAPALSVITGFSINEIQDFDFDDFQIIHSQDNMEPNLLLTPDFAMCEVCREELHDQENRRYHYPFITCTNCGPRYSIITGLPYDRPLTTMGKYNMCDTCNDEYHNPLDRRYFSQTNSCEKCGVKLRLYKNGVNIQTDDYINYVVNAWKEGEIVAIKGIGGFLLTCDATNENAIKLLRNRKQRPSKPFALMYPDIDMLKEDCYIRDTEEAELKGIVAPIVLLKIANYPKRKLNISQIADDLDRIGVMLPYTPLYDLLLKEFQKPVIATSGNISNSTIVYSNEKAIKELGNIADSILVNDREIVLPQDDSVIKFSKKHNRKIIIRRSRGLAPVYINEQLELPDKTFIATGASLKSVFAILLRGNIYISQYLGDTATYDSQLNYRKTLEYFFEILDFTPDMLFVDKHPGYFTSLFGKDIALKYDIPIVSVQHHKAHFAAVLGENNLVDSREEIMGVVFDGTGYGDDGNIWGGEFFIFQNGKIKRAFHTDYFDFILADKMVMEPRISAMAISNGIVEANPFIKKKFSDIEWKIYTKLLKGQSGLKSSSIGRLFDAVSSLVLGIDKQTYEGEAAMKLEIEASKYLANNNPDLKMSYIKNNQISDIIKTIVSGVVQDLNKNLGKELIAARFHISLVHYIKNISEEIKIKNLAFSGGVFQNGVLVDLIVDLMDEYYSLYFHKQLSPNDECVSYGQMIVGMNEM